MSEQVSESSNELQAVSAELAKQQGTTTIENAIAGMKRQLASVSKNELIRQWIGLYAKTIQLQKQVDSLRAELTKKIENEPNNVTESSDSERQKND